MTGSEFYSSIENEELFYEKRLHAAISNAFHIGIIRMSRPCYLAANFVGYKPSNTNIIDSNMIMSLKIVDVATRAYLHVGYHKL